MQQRRCVALDALGSKNELPSRNYTVVFGGLIHSMKAMMHAGASFAITIYALGLALHAAQVAWNRGVDIFADHEQRFAAAMELMALQLNSGSMQGTCQDGKSSNDRFSTFEIGYIHYHFTKSPEHCLG